MTQVTPTSAQPLVVSRAEIAKFLTLFKHADTGTYLTLRTFDQLNASIPPVISAVQMSDGQDEIIAQIAAAAQRAADHPKPTVFAPPVATFSNPRHARIEDIANGVSLSIEIDLNDPEEGLAKLQAILGTPTVVMASGSDWTNPETGEVKPKIHAHWRLCKPTATKEEHQKLSYARSLATMIAGGDRTANAVNHPLRMAGSWNRKGTPRMAQITTFGPTNEIDLQTALYALEAAVEEAGMKSQKRVSSAGAAEADPALIAEAMTWIPNDDDLYDGWISMGHAIARATGGSDEGKALFHAHSEKSGKYDHGNTEKAWDGIVSSIQTSSHPTPAGAGTIFFKAAAAGWINPRAETYVESGPELFAPVQHPAGSDARFHELAGIFEAALKARGGRALCGKMFGEIELDAQPEWIIKNWLPKGGVVAQVGESGSFKTYMLINMLLCKATGTPFARREGFAGYSTGEAGAVAMFAGEGPRGVLRRFNAAIEGNGFARPLVNRNLMVVKTVYALNHADGLAGMATEIEVQGIRPSLIGVDTFNLALDGNEDSAEEVKKAIAGARALAEMFGATVVIIDHTGHSDKLRQRGSSAKKANQDGVVICKRTGDAVELTQDKNRDADKDKFVASFKSRTIEVGTDRDTGEPLTDLWFEATDPRAAPDTTKALFENRDTRPWIGCDMAAKRYLDNHTGRDITATDLATAVLRQEMPDQEAAEPEMFEKNVERYRKHLIDEGSMAPYISRRTNGGSASMFHNPAVDSREVPKPPRRCAKKAHRQSARLPVATHAAPEQMQ